MTVGDGEDEPGEGIPGLPKRTSASTKIILCEELGSCCSLK